MIPPKGNLFTSQSLLLRFLIVIATGVALSFLWEGFSRWPESLVVPMREWITSFFNWLGKDAAIGELKFKEITRFIAEVLKAPLKWRVAVVLGVAILGHWVGGWRLAIFVFFATLYLAVFGLWKDSMKTLSIVLFAVPFAAIIGLALGIWVTRSARAARIITPLFDLMQATPHLAYLVPVVVLFGFGQVPAMLATVIFAMPPMARCAILGIQTVPSDVIESGRMSGCTPRQLLWKVQLPTSKTTLMLGLNQVVMQTLAMVVIASLVGASGLGQKLLYSLQQLKLGAAVEQGLAIVLIAIVLDRLTQRYAYRETVFFKANTPFYVRHKHLLIFLGVLLATFIAAISVRFATLLQYKCSYR